METLALEGTGTKIEFVGTGFSSDVISISLAEPAREIIETTHLGTDDGRTFTPGKTLDLGSLTCVFDDDPSQVQLLGLPPGDVVITYPPDEDGDTVEQKFLGVVISQGGQKMAMDQRMVTQITIRLVDTPPEVVPPPVIDPNGGEIDIGELITVTAPTLGAVIYYTLDGSTPTTSSTLYSGPIPAPNLGFTVSAVAYFDGVLSVVTSANFSGYPGETWAIAGSYSGIIGKHERPRVIGPTYTIAL